MSASEKLLNRQSPLAASFMWVGKCNTNGLSKGATSQSACFGIFRNHRGFNCGMFAQRMDVTKAFYAELSNAVMLAVEVAYHREWRRFGLRWIEIVLHCFVRNSYKAPWVIKWCWEAAFRCSLKWSTETPTFSKTAISGPSFCPTLASLILSLLCGTVGLKKLLRLLFLMC